MPGTGSGLAPSCAETVAPQIQPQGSLILTLCSHRCITGPGLEAPGPSTHTHRYTADPRSRLPNTPCAHTVTPQTHAPGSLRPHQLPSTGPGCTLSQPSAWGPVLTAGSHCRFTLQVLTAGSHCRFSLHVHTAGSHCRFSLQVHTVGSHCRFSLQVHTAGSHCTFTLQVHTAGSHCMFTLQVYTAGSHCRFTLQVHTAGSHCRFSLHVHTAVSHCRFTLQVHTAGYHCRFTLQVHTAGSHCTFTLQTPVHAGPSPCCGPTLIHLWTPPQPTLRPLHSSYMTMRPLAQRTHTHTHTHTHTQTRITQVV